jgi:hypothetical protein
MTVETVNDMWRAFLAAVTPPGGLPAVQVREMRRTFYAGAAAMLEASGDVCQSLSDEEAGAALDSYQDELDAFFRGVAEGRF